MGNLMDIGGIIAAIIVAVGMFLYGVLRGKKADKADQLKRNAEAHDRAKGVKDEVGSLSDADVDDRLRKRSGK